MSNFPPKPRPLNKAGVYLSQAIIQGNTVLSWRREVHPTLPRVYHRSILCLGGTLEAVLKEKMTLKKQVPRNVLDYMEDLYKKMETSQKIVEEMDTKAKAKSKKHYDKKAKMDPLKEGELVLAMTPTGKLGTLCKWEGPTESRDDLLT